MISRVMIVTFLLVFTTFLKSQRSELLPELSLTFLYIIFALAYFFSTIYLLLPKFIKNFRANIYIQTIVDVILITGFVYVTGGTKSIYSVFYPLVIIYSILFLERGGGLIIASASSISYGLLLDLEYYGMIRPPYSKSVQDSELGPESVFFQIFIHILSFYIIALLASFVVEREKKARILLAEKETAFNQLDLLHRSIIQSVDTGILTINLQCKIKSFNRAAEQITGFTFAEVENRNIVEIFPGLAQIQETIKEEHKSSTINRYNMKFTNKGNVSLTLGCSVSTLKDNKGKRIGDIVIFQDLTSIIRMEQALDKSRKLAIIGEMAAGLAHEMRNPLASISGSIQILKKDLNLNNSDVRLMHIILRGKDQLENIIKDFLLLAKPKSENREVFFIKEIIEDVIESIHFVSDWNSDIEVSLLLSNNLSILANRMEIKEVIWNLTLNAVQSMPDGGMLSIETKKVLSDDATKECLEIKLVDTGYGIDEKYFNKLFEPFFTTKEKGTGLGLAIVNRIVEAYNGTVKIENNSTKGTTCVVSLPLNK
jgi:two-component system sensor histidine kinase PilS (NtrC family)